MRKEYLGEFMARKKKIYGLMDENATKTRRMGFRLSPREVVNFNRLEYKTGLTKTEIFREAMKDYYKKLFPDE